MHLNGVAEYHRNDRLYPADPGVFATNPLSLAYGAAGVSYALHKLTGEVPQAAIDWVLQHKISSTEYPSGLYIGMAGIAWSLLEMGVRGPAEEILQSSFKHPLAYNTPDLFHGIAGWAWRRCASLKRPETSYISSKPKKQEMLCWDRAGSRSGVIIGPNRKSVRSDWRMAAAVSACSCSIFI